MQSTHCNCDLCECTVVFSAATAEASVSSLKRPPAVEGAPSTKRRDFEKGTSPEGNIQWGVTTGWDGITAHGMMNWQPFPLVCGS